MTEKEKAELKFFVSEWRRMKANATRQANQQKVDSHTPLDEIEIANRRGQALAFGMVIELLEKKFLHKD